MKKIALSLCVLSVCLTASAQSSVTLYGVVDEYLDFSSNGDLHANRLQSGGIFGSRIGFRGREDIGGGYAGIFTLEMGINADDGSLGQGGLAFGRQSFVGLATPYGDVTLGRHNAPHFYAITNYSMAGGLSYGNAANYYTDLGTVRINNSVVYQSKNYAGFSAQLMYGFGEVAGATNLGSVSSAYLSYAQGPLATGLAYTQKKTTGTNTDNYVVAGLSYDFGVVKTGLLLSSRRDDNDTHQNDLIQISAAIPVGKMGSLTVDFGQFKNKSIANANSTALSLRYDYYLSKRTTLYTGIAKINNDSAAAYGINGATGAAMAVSNGQDPRSLVFGVRHVF